MTALPDHLRPPPEAVEHYRAEQRITIRQACARLQRIDPVAHGHQLQTILHALRRRGWRGSTWRSAMRFLLRRRCRICKAPAAIEPTRGGWRLSPYCTGDCRAVDRSEVFNPPTPAEIAEECRKIRSGEVVVLTQEARKRQKEAAK